MKKIMFNDRYTLTGAVLNGTKTQTRRVEFTSDAKLIDHIGFTHHYSDNHLIYNQFDFDNGISYKSYYAQGEVVAIAQRYCDIMSADTKIDGERAADHKGWKNKMYVSSALMPFQIKITGVECERLQDISDEDCIKEGIKCGDVGHLFYYHGNSHDIYNSPREAFAALIDKVSGKGTWERNPFVIVYDFERVK